MFLKIALIIIILLQSALPVSLLYLANSSIGSKSVKVFTCLSVGLFVTWLGTCLVMIYLLQKIAFSLPIKMRSFYQACSRADENLVLYYLQQVNVDLNLQNLAGNTGLHLAAKNPYGDKVIQVLVRQAAMDANIQNQVGETAFHIACKNQYLNHVAVFLRPGQKVNPNIPDSNLFTPLHTSCYFGNLVMVKALVGHSQIDIQAQDVQGRTPLAVLEDRVKAKRISQARADEIMAVFLAHGESRIKT